MARQKRKLKILPSNFVEENRIHFDSNDELYANEHYGYYLICTIPKSSVVKNPRRYIYYKFKEQYMQVLYFWQLYFSLHLKKEFYQKF